MDRVPLVLIGGMPATLPPGDTLPVAAGGTGDTGSAWTAYVPTITAQIGNLTSYTATCRFKAIGKTVLIQYRVTIGANGSAAGYLIGSLPLPSVSTSATDFMILSGAETAKVGFAIRGQIGSNTGLIYIVRADNSYPGSDGYVLQLTGIYEAA